MNNHLKTMDCPHGFDDAASCRQCGTAITELLDAIQQRSIITAIQHYGKSGERARLMKARKALEKFAGLSRLRS